MNTPLHDLDTLVSVAETADGPARDWAACLAGLRDPTRLPHLPTLAPFAAVTASRGGPRVEPLLLLALESSDDVGALATALHAARHGTLARADVVAEHCVTHPLEGPGALPRALLLQMLDRPTPAALRCIASNQDLPEAVDCLPAMALQLCPPEDLDSTAEAIAEALTPQLQQDPSSLWRVLFALGVPPLHEDPGDVLERRIERGATLAGGAVGHFSAGRGSKRSRAARWISTALEGVPSPSAALLRALASRRLPGFDRVETAAWLVTFSPTDPVTDVLRGAGAHAPTLGRARQAITLEDVDRVAEVDTVGADDLLLPLLAEDGVAETLLARVLSGVDDGGSETRLQAAAPQLASLVPELLSDRESRPLGLTIAPFAPTESTLAALLQMPVPHAPELRAALAFGLASMGDHAALPALADLRSLDRTSPGLRTAIALAESILQTSV